MKRSIRIRIDELARLAIAEEIATIREGDAVPPPVYRATQAQTRRTIASPFPFVAAALAAFLVLPPLAVGGDAGLSRISATAHGRGSVERCRTAALDILSLAAKGRRNVPGR